MSILGVQRYNIFGNVYYFGKNFFDIIIYSIIAHNYSVMGQVTKEDTVICFSFMVGIYSHNCLKIKE